MLVTSTQEETPEHRLAEFQLQELESRVYPTYKCRLTAAERLASRNRAWNSSLISMSTATTIASIALLTKPDIYGIAGPTILVSPGRSYRLVCHWIHQNNVGCSRNPFPTQAMT